MDMSSPPCYRRHSSRSGLEPPSGSELPPYTHHGNRRNTLTQPVAPMEHVFQLADGKNRPWIILKINSSAKSSRSLPTFFEKENINGQLEVLAEKGDSIQAITISIVGHIITGANSGDTFTFLNHVIPVWAKSCNTPRLPSPSEGALNAKLSGHCVWPLSIPLPKVVNIPSGVGDCRPFRLPETFLERNTPVSVQYELAVHVSRGKLRSSSQIKTAFGYVPSTRPESPSFLRQLAYQGGSPLPIPSADPVGWKTLRPVTARGLMDKNRKVDARCTLSIAKPLCYTRGTVIPCFLSLESGDPYILKAFSTPSSIVVSLRRRLRFYNATIATRQDVAWNEIVEDVGSAVWWPSADGQNDAFVRSLEGEIRLAKDLRPTSEMGHFSISYSVVLCPFDVENFSSEPAALISEPVEIATMYGKGPRPHAYSPPAYDPISRRKDEYNATMPSGNSFFSLSRR